MIKLSNRNKYFLGLALMLLMLATRGNHFASLQHLPSASLAIFFLAGAYVQKNWFFPILLLEAALLDYVAITFGGVSSFCVSSAYSLLILSYGVMWLSGSWYSTKHRLTLASLGLLTVTVLCAITVSEIISSGGFYYLSGRFEGTNLSELFNRLVKYSPSSFQNTAFYVGCAVLIHIIVAAVNTARTVEKATH